MSLFPYLCKQQKILLVPLSGLGKQHPLAVASAGSPSTALNRGSDAGATFLATAQLSTASLSPRWQGRML